MKVLGHADAQTTMKYQHPGLEQIRRAVEERKRTSATSRCDMPLPRSSYLITRWCLLSSVHQCCQIGLPHSKSKCVSQFDAFTNRRVPALGFRRAPKRFSVRGKPQSLLLASDHPARISPAVPVQPGQTSTDYGNVRGEFQTPV